MARWHREHPNFPSIYGCEDLRKELARRIAPVLRELTGERVRDVLPALESLYVEIMEPLGPVHEALGQFVSARRLSGHPVAFSRWIWL